MLTRCLVCLLEALCALLVAVLERLASSPAVHRLFDLAIQATASFSTQLLAIDPVRQAAAETIAEGMNCFLRQPNLEEHLLQMADTMSRTQPELARKQGRDFPVLVGNFLQGMLSPNRDPKPNKQSSLTRTTTENKEENTVSSRGSSPALSPLPRSLSFPILRKTWSNEDGVSKRTHDTHSADSCALSEPDVLMSASDVLMDDSSFHYRYGPIGVGGVGSSSSCFATAEQKKNR